MEKTTVEKITVEVRHHYPECESSLVANAIPDNLTIQAIVAGAVWDFAGRLSSMDPPVTFGANLEVYPLIEIVSKFLNERSITPDFEALVIEWENIIKNIRVVKNGNEKRNNEEEHF